MKGLKRCPFCNHKARLWYAVGDGYLIECENDKCGCVYGNNMGLTSDEVIKLWNKRTADKEN